MIELSNRFEAAGNGNLFFGRLDEVIAVEIDHPVAIQDHQLGNMVRHDVSPPA
ncbi:hypothetical protein D3C86_2129190 [compost metagenome]